MSILDLTLAVTEFIQGREIDMADVSYLLDFLKSVILSKRNNVNEFHNNCHGIILEVPRVISINETEARTATFQTSQNNVPAKSGKSCNYSFAQSFTDPVNLI